MAVYGNTDNDDLFKLKKNDAVVLKLCRYKK